MDDTGALGKDSVDQSSDVWHEFVCAACDKDGNNVGASNYCIECGGNLCRPCVKQHNRFVVMRTHQMLDKCVDVKNKPRLPSQRCGVHSDKLIDIYCPAHDDVCCSVCVALEHGSCQGMKYLPDAAKGFKISDERRQFEADLRTTQSKLSDLKQDMKRKAERLHAEEEKLLGEIETVRDKVDAHVRNIHGEIRNKVKLDMKSEIDSTNNNVAEIDDQLASINNQEGLLKDLDKANDSDMFVHIKTGKRDTDLGLESLNKYENESMIQKEFCLQFDYYVRMLMAETTSLAAFTAENDVTAAAFDGDFSIKIPGDTKLMFL